MSHHRAFDWADVLDRLKLSEQRATAAGIDDETRKRILQRRAEALAVPVRQQATSGANDSVTILRIGADRFALPLADMVEVIRDAKVAIAPRAPNWVAGLVQVRVYRSVYHLHRLLGLERSVVERPTTILLVKYSGAAFGIGVDSVEDVRSVPQSARKPAGTTRGHAGWATEDLIPCLALDSLLNVDSTLKEE